MKVLIYVFVFFPMVALCQKMEDIETDSSIISFRYIKERNTILTMNSLKERNIFYMTEKYLDTNNLRMRLKYENGYLTDITNIFSKNGKLEESLDHDAGKWIVFQKEKYPFYDLKMRMKLKGDCIIKNIYSTDFFENHVVWNFYASETFKGENKVEYTQSIKEVPDKYLLVYDIYIQESSIGKVRKTIKFALDSIGNLIKNDEIKGFEKLSKMTDKTFVIDYEKAFIKVKSFEKDVNDTTNYEVILKWDEFERQGKYSGKYWYYFLVPTEIINKKVKGYSSYVEYMYNVYVFDPWTSEFVEMNKMKMVDMISYRCHTNTGLMLIE